jgi:hypothetical protein
MPLLYNFDIERPEELLAILAQNVQKRRLEKKLPGVLPGSFF